MATYCFSPLSSCSSSTVHSVVVSCIIASVSVVRLCSSLSQMSGCRSTLLLLPHVHLGMYDAHIQQRCWLYVQLDSLHLVCTIWTYTMSPTVATALNTSTDRQTT